MKQRTQQLTSILGALLLAAMWCAPEGNAAGTNKVGTAAGTFLRIPVGARAVGMGGAFVSLANDPSSLFWNPAALATDSSSGLLADHAPWLPGMTFDYLGVVLPLQELGTVGFAVTILQTEEMDVTTPAQQMGTGETFRASSLSLGFSFSRALTDRFDIGGSVKYIHETIFNSSATALAFDVGTLYETPFFGIRLGACISNFGTKLRMDGDDLNVRIDIAPDQEGNNQSIVGSLHTDPFDLPLIMRVGISGEVVRNDELRITLAADAVTPNDNAPSLNLGSEIALLGEKVRVSAGYRDVFLRESEFGFAGGIGVHDIRVTDAVGISLHYAYQQYVHFGQTNRFTLGLHF